MIIRAPVLSVSTWIALIAALALPPLIIVLFYGAQSIQLQAFESDVRTSLSSRTYAMSGHAAMALLTRREYEAAADNIQKTGHVAGLSIATSDGQVLYTRNYACDQKTLSNDEHELSWQGDHLCLWVPVLLAKRNTPNSIYESQLFGDESTIPNTQSNIIGYVGVSLTPHNTGLQNRLLLFMSVLAFCSVATGLVGARMVIGRSFGEIVSYIQLSKTDKMRSLLEGNSVVVKELREIGEAYLQQEIRSKDLTGGLLLASETEDVRVIKISAEIHDKLCAQLHVIKRVIEQSNCETQLGTVRADWLSRIDEADRVAREIIGNRRSDVTEALGLEAGIREAASSFHDRRIIVVYRAEVEPTADKHKHIERIVFEATRNATLHSYATQIKVIVESNEVGDFICVIKDNGIGFNQHDVKTGRYGVVLMTERCSSALGVPLSISSSDTGTQIRFQLAVQDIGFIPNVAQ